MVGCGRQKHGAAPYPLSCRAENLSGIVDGDSLFQHIRGPGRQERVQITHTFTFPENRMRYSIIGSFSPALVTILGSIYPNCAAYYLPPPAVSKINAAMVINTKR